MVMANKPKFDGTQNVKPLRTEYSKNGVSYRLLRQDSMAAIYEGRIANVVATYEVVSLRVAWVDGPYTKEPYFGYTLPSNEEWGRYGWSYRKLEDAEAKLISLQEAL
jgi:hypothetical protein